MLLLSSQLLKSITIADGCDGRGRDIDANSVTIANGCDGCDGRGRDIDAKDLFRSMTIFWLDPGNAMISMT